MSLFTSAAVGAACGLVAAPHCIVMCGPIAAACGRARTQTVAYTLMRLAAYTTLGALVAGIAAPIAALLPPPVATLMLGLAMALALVLSAKRLLVAAAPDSRPDVPVAQLLRKDERGAPPVLVASLLGLGTGLLPCGALHTGLLVAVGTGTALGGGISMLAFGVVSGLPLLGAGLLTKRLTTARPAMRRVVFVALVLGSALVMARPIAAILAPDEACHG
jgi:sulfite exporter TauE/SafE